VLWNELAREACRSLLSDHDRDVQLIAALGLVQIDRAPSGFDQLFRRWEAGRVDLPLQVDLLLARLPLDVDHWLDRLGSSEEAWIRLAASVVSDRLREVRAGTTNSSAGHAGDNVDVNAKADGWDGGVLSSSDEVDEASAADAQVIRQSAAGLSKDSGAALRTWERITRRDALNDADVELLAALVTVTADDSEYATRTRQRIFEWLVGNFG
jgi:hypothetical protein